MLSAADIEKGFHTGVSRMPLTLSIYRPGAPACRTLRSQASRTLFVALVGCPLAGCSSAGAPSFELFGAFFPAWMLCALLGIVGAAGARVVLTSPTFNDDPIPFQLAVCTSAGVVVALLGWMVLFG